MTGCNCSRCQEYHRKVVNNPVFIWRKRAMNMILHNTDKAITPIFKVVEGEDTGSTLNAEFKNGKLEIS